MDEMRNSIAESNEKERKIKLIQLKEIYKNQRNQNIIKC